METEPLQASSQIYSVLTTNVSTGHRNQTTQQIKLASICFAIQGFNNGSYIICYFWKLNKTQQETETHSDLIRYKQLTVLTAFVFSDFE